MNRVTVLFVGVAIMIAAAANAGIVRLGSATVEGNRVIVPVYLDGDTGQGVSAMDFRLRYDPQVLRPVSASAGAAAAAADKQVATNVSAPGEYAVLLMGMNQNSLSGGEVANIVFERVGDPEGGRSSLQIMRTTLSSSEGTEIPSNGSTGTVRFPPGASEPADRQPKEPEASEPTEQPKLADGTSPRRVAAAQPTDAAKPPQRVTTPAAGGAPETVTGGLEAANPQARELIAQGIRDARDVRDKIPTPGVSPDTAPEAAGNEIERPGRTRPPETKRDLSPGNMTLAQGAPTEVEETAEEGARTAQKVEDTDEPAVDSPEPAAQTESNRIGVKVALIGLVVVAAGVVLLRRKLFG